MGMYEAAIALIAEAKVAEHKRCCRIIRENCQACGGTGVSEVRTAPNGRDEEPIECLYCGIPIHEIMEG